MTAFDHAWTLLKQRGFEVMPQQRAGPSLAPTMQQQLEALESGDFSQVEEARRLEERRNKAEEREIDPMTRHLLNQQAEDIEAEGIELPDMPSSGPPADIGLAGSLSPEPNLRELYFGSNNQTPVDRNEFITADDFMRPPVPIAPQRQAVRVNNPFDPNEVALMRQTLANEQTPLGQALARVRAGSGPQPLQFDQ